MNRLAPVALFVYNRPLHTRRTLDALAANEGAADSDLYVFSDGPRDFSSANAVEEVRAIVASARGFRRVEIVSSPTNLGLAGSIISGVTRLCDMLGKVIVVEDDLVTSRWFLRYLNDGLEVFRDDYAVGSIHAYLPPLRRQPMTNFFLYGADCWGWATWRRAWQDFIPDGQTLLDALATHSNQHYFDYIGAFPHTDMLRGYISGRNNSWAIRWHASMFLGKRLTLHPARTLVKNIGMDGSGTHCSNNDDMNSPIIDEPLAVQRVPLVHADEQWREFRRQYVWQMARRGLRKVLPWKD